MASNPVSDRLRIMRDMSGLSPVEIAEISGLSGAHIGLILGGERGENITAVAALALCRVFGCSVQWLVLGRGRMPTPKRVAAVVKARQKGKRVRRTAVESNTLDEALDGLLGRVADLEKRVAAFGEEHTQ